MRGLLMDQVMQLINKPMIPSRYAEMGSEETQYLLSGRGVVSKHITPIPQITNTNATIEFIPIQNLLMQHNVSGFHDLPIFYIPLDNMYGQVKNEWVEEKACTHHLRKEEMPV